MKRKRIVIEIKEETRKKLNLLKARREAESYDKLIKDLLQEGGKRNG